MVQNKVVTFTGIPKGFPVPGKDLTLETRTIDLTPPAGGLVIKNHVVSLDPYMRGRMRDPDVKSYSPPFTLNAPINSSGISKVIKSDSPDFKEGDIVSGHVWMEGDVICGNVGMEEYSIIPKEYLSAFKVVENPHNLPLSYFVGVLGMPGLTAYSSFYEIGQPKKGETIFVSAASGAVGSIVGQLAKREGLRVIGSAGSDDKVAYLKNELSFDEAFNYRTESPWTALRRYAPEGIDIYYDNVGGETLDAALENTNNFARMVECGMISQYNIADRNDMYGVKNLIQVLLKRITMRGFIVSDANMGPKYAQEHQKNVSEWLANKEFVYRESVTEGLENAIDGFIGMLQGRNFGKAILKIADI